MKSGAFRKLSDEEIDSAFLGEGERSSISRSADPTESQIDISAPQGGQTPCAVKLANQVLEIARKRFSDNQVLAGLISFYDQLDNLLKSFFNPVVRQTWCRDNYENFDREINSLRGQLNQFGFANLEEINELRCQFREIQQELQGPDKCLECGHDVEDEDDAEDRKLISGLLFTPQFSFLVYTREQDGHVPGEIRERGGRPIRKGSFVAVDVDERICFHKIPLLLGLDKGFHILAATPENISELQNVRLKTEWKEDRYIDQLRLRLKTLYAQPYEDAALRVKELIKYLVEREAEREKHKDADQHLEIIDVDRDYAVGQDQSMFGIGLSCFTDELDALVSKSGLSETQVMGLVVEWINRSGSLDDIETYFVKNRGDADDLGKHKVKRSTKRFGKPGGLGFPGGGVEPDCWSKATEDYLKKILPPVLWQKTRGNSLQSSFFYRKITNLCREIYGESGRWPIKIYGRVARIVKNQTHLTEFWLVRLERSASGGVRELNEIDCNQTKDWLKLGEVFQMRVGGLDVQGKRQRKDLPYCSHLRVLVENFLERQNIPLTDGMKSFKGRLKK
ncbi:MAG: hypothetical protein HZB99_04525 [Candidatus Harrisonbacteria bacterium]|nr:hypothetical protein [Candidatus Harrisonbacteria bacterium]